MVSDTEDVWKSIISFVKASGYNDFLGFKKPLTKNTELQSDLKITGDDAHEFMADFAKVFGVNMASFDPCSYFESEGFLYGLFMAFYPKAVQNSIGKKKKIITLEMLEQAARSGVWRGEEIDNIR